VLLLGIAGILFSVEIAVRLGFERLSRTQSHVAGELRQAVSPAGGSECVVLLVGNSLLEAAVDAPTLQTLVGGNLRVRRVAVVSTQYFDWFYGLRRLFMEGARPSVVAVMIDENQLIQSRMRWDYTAHYLLDPSDVVRAGREAGADWTRISSMIVASGSAFWGSRVELRNWMLEVMMGGGAERLKGLAYRPSRRLSREEYVTQLSPRLARLQQAVAERGARLWIIVPPRPTGPWHTDGIRHVAERLGAKVLVPVEPGRLSDKHFADGLHLNAEGARIFMAGLAAQMRTAAVPN
jgi:hypothetical protein